MVDVLRRKEVLIDGKYYPTTGPVLTSVASQYPQKLVLGDVDKDSNPRTSIVTWDDFTEGVGLYSTDGKSGLRRAGNLSLLETRYAGHLVLPRLVVYAASPSVSGTIDEINELSGLIYAALNNGTDAYSWTPSSDSWSSKLHDFPAAVTDSLHFTLAGTEYVAFAHTGGYTYTSDGSTWTDDGTDTLHLAFWDDRLWGIDNVGQLWFSTVIGTEVNDAKLSLPAGYVNSLFVGPDANGNDILYAATEVGLYAHDAANSRFVRTKVVFPQNANAGKGAAVWNGDIYISPGELLTLRYDPVAGKVFSIGLDRDGGISSTYSGTGGTHYIDRLIPTTTGLMASVRTSGGLTGSMWEYNGKGWHYIHDEVNFLEGAHISGVNSSYRLYWGLSSRLKYMDVPVGYIDPDVKTISYTINARNFLTPWFNAGQNDIDKLAVRIRADCSGMSADETVSVGFYLDYTGGLDSDQFTITVDGVTVRTFPTLADNSREAGQVFRAIRFYLALDRGSTATNTPNLKSLSLEWRRKLEARYGFQGTINRTLPSRDKRNQAQMKADLITAVEKDTQVEFTFVDEAGVKQNYFVDLTIEDVQQTGKGEIGRTKFFAVEN